MAQKWNLQDIVPPDRARRSQTQQESRSPAPQRQALRQTPPREMRVRESEMRRMDVPLRRSEERMAPARDRQIVEPQEEEVGYEEEGYAPPQGGMHGRSRDERQEDYAERPPAPQEEAYEPLDRAVARLQIEDGRLARLRRAIFVGVAFAIIGGLGLGVTIAMTGAEVMVKPKMVDTALQATFTAKVTPATGELGYELLTLEEEGQRQVAASGKEDVQLRAEGEITVYNGHSATPQKLVKNTRFEAPGGLIYRITDGITIPGYAKDASGTVKPGSVKVKVLADGTGETYNISDVRLTVPGLKDTDQYTSIYGEVDKTGIQGGFAGTRYVIDEGQLATVKQELHTELRDKLLTRIRSERPNGFTVFEPAITFAYDSLPAGDAGSDTAVIKERARLLVPLFNEALFASFIAKNTIAGYGGEPVRIENPSALTFAYEGSPLEDISKTDSLSFVLSGAVRILWKFDPELLKQDLLGLPKDDLNTVLKKYPAIDKAKATIRPIWKRSFPESSDDIRVSEVLELP